MNNWLNEIGLLLTAGGQQFAVSSPTVQDKIT